MQQNKKVFILAGEESGDIYAGEIARNLKIINENVEIYGIGGENLSKQGANLIEHIKNLSFLGIFEVVKHIPNVYKILNKVKNFLKEFQPDYIILIDFPDFNFRIAKFAKNIGLKVNEPIRECTDKNCPFHGGLSIRGKLFDGKVTGDKAKQTITLTKDEPIYFSKFKRYARGKSTIHAHVPGCIDVTSGDHVLTAECRPISKSVSYVVIEVRS